MKTKLQLLNLTILMIIFGSLYSVSAQKVGGYKEVSVDDEIVVAAAEFAVNAKAEKDDATIELVSIEKAERQTVAGTNYRLCLTVSIEEEEKQVLAVIFRNLKQEFSLTSWIEKQCAEEKE